MMTVILRFQGPDVELEEHERFGLRRRDSACSLSNTDANIERRDEGQRFTG